VLRRGGGAEAFSLGFGAALAVGRAAGFGAGLAAAGFLGLPADFGEAGVLATGLAGLGAGFLTAGLLVERAAGLAALAFFAGAGRPVVRRSFAMFVLLWRSRQTDGVENRDQSRRQAVQGTPVR
jgi:tetrahydromethanopterin S-methyltransferase subunit F